MPRSNKRSNALPSQSVNLYAAMFYRLSNMPPFLMLLLILSLAVAVTHFYMETCDRTRNYVTEAVSNAESTDIEPGAEAAGSESDKAGRNTSGRLSSETESTASEATTDETRRNDTGETVTRQDAETTGDDTDSSQTSKELPWQLKLLGLAYILLMLKDSIVQFRRAAEEKKNRIAAALVESTKLNFLNTPITLEIPISTRHLWTAIKDNLKEEIIKGTDTRRTHWEIRRTDHMNKKMDLTLRYTNDPLGRKPYQISARDLTCSLKLNTGGGRKTQVELIFNARNPMDYRNVLELIDRTKEAIKQVAMKAEPVDSYGFEEALR